MSIEDGHEIHQNRFQHIRIISLFHSFYQENPEIFQIMKNFVLAIQKTKKKNDGKDRNPKKEMNFNTKQTRLGYRSSFFLFKNKQENCVGETKGKPVLHEMEKN